MTIDKPGLYGGVDETAYHSGEAFGMPTICCSDCKVLARPGGAALWRWQHSHPEPPRKTFDIGSAVHSLVLDSGPDVVAISGDWRSKDKKDEVQEARADGLIPLHTAEFEQVEAMADAVTSHPVAKHLLDAEPRREATGLVDGGDGLWRRCRFDAIGASGIVDLKTCLSADPEVFARKAIDLGYHLQAAFYRDMAQQLGITDGPFTFVCVEKTPPYLVSIIRMDEDTEQLGRDTYQRAIETFKAATLTDTWPGYPAEVTTITAPPWAFEEEEEEIEVD